MAASWFVRGGGKVYGPLDAAKLKQLAVEGKINDATEVAQNFSGPWYPASKVKGLFSVAGLVATSTPSSHPPAARSVPTPMASAQPPVTKPASTSIGRVLTTYYPRSTNGKVALIAGVCSLVSLLLGYFAGREHLRYQIRSTFENAGKQFVNDMREGFGKAFGEGDAEPEKKPPAPKARLKLGQTVETAEATFVVHSARMDYPLLKGGFRDSASKHNEECLVLGLTITNVNDRKQLRLSYGRQFGSNTFEMQDDVGNDVDTMFFSSPGSDFLIVGSHPEYKELDPEQTVEHLVAFKRPLPKTKSLTLLVDMALIGQEGVVQYDIPIESVEGFAAN
jgi:hypothetical protein